MFFKYIPLLTTKDQEYAAKIRDVLAQNNIKCRTRSTNARINPAPNPGMPVGGIGNGAMQWSTIIQVHKSDFEYAKALIANIYTDLK